MRRAEATDRLLTRLFGRPTETVQVEKAPPPKLALLQGLDLEQRLELLARIRGLKDEPVVIQSEASELRLN